MNLSKILKIKHHVDNRGFLGIIESPEIPFTVKRMYFICDVPVDCIRGEHGHKKLEQLIFCMNGACEITLNDGETSQVFSLRNPEEYLYIPKGIWRSIRFIEPNTVVTVLASRTYEKDDYIFELEEFKKWKKLNSQNNN